MTEQEARLYVDRIKRLVEIGEFEKACKAELCLYQSLAISVATSRGKFSRAASVALESRLIDFDREFF